LYVSDLKRKRQSDGCAKAQEVFLARAATAATAAAAAASNTVIFP